MAALRARLPDGSAHRTSARLRHIAASDRAVTTGMVLREFTTLLDIEVSEPRLDGLPRPAVLPSTAKYSLRPATRDWPWTIPARNRPHDRRTGVSFGTASS
ncbi:hypothetical protein [Streptomyces siamensis]|uniref:Uncharacterized protein n=1 Tax=Streptomyces siamensis TaxID=1274986 RepID=A0ABP9J7P7_9ACTN